MEDGDGIGDNEVDPLPAEYPGESEFSEDITGYQGKYRRKIFTTSGNEEWRNQQKKNTEQKRADHIANTIRNFRIAHAGDGLLRGSFPKIPNQFKNLEHQMKHLERAMEQFKLEGDDLNISGSFDKGYTVSRQDPCSPPQESGGF